MHLRESILRKTADEKAVDSVLDQYRKNNPDHAQLMRDDQIKGYIAHKNALKNSDAEHAELQRRYKAQGTGDISKGTIGEKLMKVNRARAANRAIIAKFEKERGLRREGGMDQKQLDAYQKNRQDIQNVYANEMAKHLPEEYFKEGAVIDRKVFADAQEKAKIAAEAYGEKQFGLFDMDKAKRWDAYSKYLSSGGNAPRVDYTGPGMDTKMKTLALNYGLDEDDPKNKGQKNRVRWEYGQSWLKNPNLIQRNLMKFQETALGQEMGALGVPVPVPGYGQMPDPTKIHNQKINYNQRFTPAVKAQQEMAKKEFATATADTSGKYAQKRRDKVTGFLKKNWLPIAGLGLGALGVMGIMGMRGRQGGGQPQQAQAVGQQQRQPGVDDWAHNRNFRARGGTPQQTVIGAQSPGGFDISSTFKKFMGGMSG